MSYRFLKEKEHKAFLDEVIALCNKYNLSLSHEDSQGGFMIDIYREENINWLRDAFAVNLEEYKDYKNVNDDYFKQLIESKVTNNAKALVQLYIKCIDDKLEFVKMSKNNDLIIEYQNVIKNIQMEYDDATLDDLKVIIETYPAKINSFTKER